MRCLGVSLVAIIAVCNPSNPSTSAASRLSVAPSASALETPYPSAAELFARMATRHRWQEAQLNRLSEVRTYTLQNDGHRVLAEEVVSMKYRAPHTKIFTLLSGSGSGAIRKRVFESLIEDEQQRVQSSKDPDNLITPENYSLEVVGSERIGDSECLVVHIVPKRSEPHLFEGKIWMDMHDDAIVKITGRLARSPSFWIKHVDFQRVYEKIQGLWLVSRVEAVSPVRILGTRILTIDYKDHEVHLR